MRRASIIARRLGQTLCHGIASPSTRKSRRAHANVEAGPDVKAVLSNGRISRVDVSQGDVIYGCDHLAIFSSFHSFVQLVAFLCHASLDRSGSRNTR